MSDALNQKISFDENFFLNLNENFFFKINESIRLDYRRMNLIDFINKYFKKDNNIYIFKNEYRNDKYLFSVLYYCFINNYKVLSEDIDGKYFIKDE